MKLRVNILYFAGTQCEQETRAAYNLAGFDPRLIFINEILNKKVRITDCDVCHIPGGFSEMDCIRVGAIAAAIARDELPKLKDKSIPTCGVCNGFQIMTEAELFGPSIMLFSNDCGTFVSRPVKHRIVRPDNNVNCIWTNGLEGQTFEFPSAHGSGKLITGGYGFYEVMQYVGRSPNGGKSAGITDESGLFLGLMDHWERPWNNPAGQAILANLKQHL